MSLDHVEDIYELSPLQEGMLFHTLYAPASGIYVEQSSFVVRNHFDLEAYERAWQTVVDRHTILRTSFDWQGSKPLQIVHRHVRLPFSVEDWRSLDAGTRARNWEAYLQHDVQRGFELSQAPLLRLAIVRTADQEYRVVLSVHHLLLDGWSSNHVVREVASLYEGFVRAERVDLGPVRPFGDYIAWLQKQEESSAQAFWKRQLAGYKGSPRLNIGTPPARDFQDGADVDFRQTHVSLPQVDMLRQLARRHELTLNTILQGTWALLLSRYTGELDVVFGATVSGRHAELVDVETMVGLFINTLPVRARVAPEAQLVQWFKELQAAQFQVRQFEHTSLVQIQSWCGVPGSAPLFETLLAFENLPGVEASRVDADALQLRYWGRTNYPLAVMVVPSDGLLIKAMFEAGRFEPAAVERLLAHFVELLRAVGEQSTVRLSDLGMLTPVERAELLAWNATDSGYPRHATVHQLFEHQVGETPGAVAAAFEGTHLTYAELNGRASRLARRLRDSGIGTESVVAISVEGTVDLVTAMLGVLKAGGAYLAIDHAYPNERVRFMLEDSGAVALVSSRALSPKLSAGDIPLVVLDDHESTSDEDDAGPSAATAGNLAYVMYTSGSTGRPKAAAITHRAVIRTVCDTNYITLVPSDTVAQVSNVCFDAATFEIWGALLNGARLVGIPREVVLSPHELDAVLRRERVSALFVTTDLFNQLIRERADLFAGIRTLLFGGSAVDPRWVSACLRAGPPGRLLHVYGPTETTTFASWFRVEQVDEADRTVPIGAPLANTHIYVVAPDMTPLPIGVAGEIVIGGDGLAREYLHAPEQTAAKFVADRFSGRPGARLYRTGDRGRRRADGALEFIGRFDHQVKIRGFRVELGEIEEVLRGHPSVTEAVVVAREDAPGSRRLVAYVVPASRDVTVAELRRFLQAKLPDYMVPSAFALRDGLPLTATGKIDRKALEAVAERFVPEKPYAEARSPAEETLAGIWAEVLALDRVGIRDNFFELGGDSIFSIRIVARAREAGLDLTLRQLFENPTIAALAGVVGTGTRARADQEALDGEAPLTPIQLWFFEDEPMDAHHFNQALLIETPPALEPRFLAQAMQHVLTHHDALRLRYLREAGVWRQFFARTDEPAVFHHVDLRAIAENEARREIEQRAAEDQASLDLTNGPLLRVSWFDLGERPGRLLFVAHHLTIDAVSWRIILEDFWGAYGLAAEGRSIALPAKTSSVRQWAIRLRELAESPGARRELVYWIEGADGASGRVPADQPGGEDSAASAGLVTVELSERDTQALVQDVPKAYRIQINDALLTALAQTLAAWTGNHIVRFDLEGHGREPLFDDLDLTRTVGWFTTIFPVRLDVAGDHPGDTLRLVKEQLRQIPNRGVTFGVLKYLSPDREIAARLRALPTPDVSFNYLGQSGSADDLESTGPYCSPRAKRRHPIDINAYIAGGRLRVLWEFGTGRHHPETIQRVAADFLDRLRAIVTHCRSSPGERFTPSDFAQARINQSDLDKLVAAVNESEEAGR